MVKAILNWMSGGFTKPVPQNVSKRGICEMRREERQGAETIGEEKRRADPGIREEREERGRGGKREEGRGEGAERSYKREVHEKRACRSEKR